MTQFVPTGYLFRPTDQQLLKDYLGTKIMGQPQPCDVIIDRDIYGAGDKAPWQIFTNQDPWEICKTKDNKKIKTEGTIYVFTTLIKAPGNTRIARTAGCGSWHGETALQDVVDDNGFLIGHKRMLCFQITNESEVMKRGHWIMHEYSSCGGCSNTDASQGEYVLCRIKFDDSKPTKKSPTMRKRKDTGVSTINDEDLVPQPAKRVRMQFLQEEKKKMECDNIAEAAPKTDQVVPLSEEVFVQDKNLTAGDDPNDGESDEVLADGGGLVSLVEQEESFGLDYDYDDASGNVSFPTEVVSSAVAVTSSVPMPLDTSENYGQHYLNSSHILVQNPVHTENIWSGVRPIYQQEQKMGCVDDAEELHVQDDNFTLGDLFSQPVSGFHATAEPSPIVSVSKNMHVQQDPETIWQLKTMPWPEDSLPQFAMEY